ncbi:DUF6702 family protein [Hymenobacter weizhouensis]|uniref:DUF6702 family protein n=1 Tax=Hymenobacter sp. YIM 151500-1 TaxID=2987689 RepID=UPI0022277923|nr:DUF6702 family protein [Hymenobacter sp. YIM 151500-1]UYZ63257.1 hypothetical protein OIS53_00070 [Hymenobacter sp. YIM 151500-1]
MPVTRRLLLPLLLLLPLAVAWAHAYHASILEMRHNSQKQRLEMALKIFTDDLEKALSEGQPAPVRLDVTPRAQLNPLLTRLLTRSVQLSLRPGQPAQPLTLVGLQKETDAYWLYFTAPAPATLTGLTLHHRLLLDLFPDQMNIVNLDAGGHKQSLLFREGQEKQEVKW